MTERVSGVTLPILWTLEQAAEAVQVSPNYLRAADCPRVYLPSNRRGGRPLLRFRPEDVRAWTAQWSTAQRLQKVS